MAVSGSIDFAATRDDLITEALEQLGVLGEGESPSANQLTSCSRTLNMMLKAWQADEVNLFAIEKTYLFLQNDQIKYELSSAGDNWTTELINTAIATAASSTDTVIAVDDGASTANSDIIGIELDGGSIQWTTISSGGGTNSITIAAALTDDAAVGNRVYAYTTKANRPMKIIEAALTDASDLTDIPLKVEPLRSYVSLTNKVSEGRPTTLYFDPQRVTSYVYVWPEPDRVDYFITLWVQRTLDDLDAATDDVDFPQEWFMAISLNLAVALSPKYGVTGTEFRQLQFLADYYLDLAKSYDTEGGFTIEPSNERNREV